MARGGNIREIQDQIALAEIRRLRREVTRLQNTLDQFITNFQISTTGMTIARQTTKPTQGQDIWVNTSQANQIASIRLTGATLGEDYFQLVKAR